MKILLKFPVRYRVEKFMKVLTMYRNTCTNPENIILLVSLDSDDTEFSEWVVNSIYEVFPVTIVKRGQSNGKIDAVNRDIEDLKLQWDIVVVASDDMTPQVKGWDVEIIEKMPQDLDHVLFYNDGYCGSKLNTMCILGKTYYERFHYIYHPAYKSLWCDNEFMEVANMLGKQTYYNTCLFRHDHFANNKLLKPDRLMEHNQSWYFQDAQTYQQRKLINFNINVQPKQ